MAVAIPRTIIHAFVLGGFSMAAAILLAGGNLLTADEIRLRAIEDLQASLTQVIPAAIHDNSPVADALVVDGTTVYRATRDGIVTGIAFETVGKGYAGDIRVIMGIDTDGRILGARVVSHTETPGLGDKIEVQRSDWITRFTGLSLGDPPEDKWKVKKDGGPFDQFSGATVTPRAVVNAVRDGLKFFSTHRTRLLEVK